MSGARLLLRKDGADVREIELDGKTAWVGRDASCDLRLEDLLVSRKHAELQRVEGGLEIYNRSEFGILQVNGKEVPRAALAAGDRVAIGPFELRVLSLGPPTVAETVAAPEAPMDFAPLTETPAADLEPLAEPAPEPAAEPEPSSPEPGRSPESSLQDFLTPELKETSDSKIEVVAQPAEAPMREETTGSANTRVLSNRRFDVRLVFPNGAANVQEFFIRKQKIILGRGSDCDVILTTKKASRHHASIERRGMIFTIRDLGSANGVFVNGVQVTEKDLAGDDRIQIGEHEFSFAAQSEGLGASTSPSIMQERTQSGFTSGFAQPQAAGIPSDLIANLPPPLTGQILKPAESKPATPLQVYLQKFRDLPLRKRIVYAGVLIAALLFAFEEDEAPVRNRKVAGGSKAGQVEKQKRTLADLTPEQRKYVESQYGQALDAFQNRQYDATLLALQKVFEVLPDYRDAREYERYAQEGKRAQEEVADRKRKEAEEAQLKRRVAQLTEEIGGLMQRREYEVAEQLFSEIQAIDPENTQVKTWQAEIASARELERQKAEEARIRAEVDQKASQILGQGRGKLQAGRYLAAIESFQAVPATGTGNGRILKDAKAGIAEAKKALDVRIGPILELAREAQGRGDLIEAFKQYRAVLKIDPTNGPARAATQSMRTTLHERGKILYTEGVLAESYSDFETARQRFEEVMLALPDDDIYFQRASRKLMKIDKFVSKEKI